MAIIKFKRGLESNRLTHTPALGEIINTTDTRKVFIGDGVTVGGIPINQSSTEILTKILTVDGTGSGLNGDLIDGILGTTLLRNDQDGTLTGTLTVDDKIFSAITQNPNTNPIVDVFLYDTTKDSDCGDWRKRTSHTSWYNETLNTTTRGATKEFPAMALIIAESNVLTIYDATDSSCPMWMVFNTHGGSMLRSGLISSICGINGIICVGRETGGAFHIVNLLKETSQWLTGSPNYGGYYSRGNIINRNYSGSSGYIENVSGSNLPTIINSSISDVTITVLPNAPIDTGLHIPTVVITTPSGMSVIHNDNTINDISGAWGYESVNIADDKLIVSTTNGTNDRIEVGPIPYEDIDYTVWIEDLYTNASTPALLTNSATQLPIVCNDYIAVGANAGLTIIKDDMVSYIDNTYQSGWMSSDIKGAFLANSKIADRSINNNPLVEIGTITESPVETSSELNTYSGFSSTNYLEQSYNSDLDFGVGDFYTCFWMKSSSINGASNLIFDRYSSNTSVMSISLNSSGLLSFNINSDIMFSSNKILEDRWHFIYITRNNGIVTIYINGEINNTTELSGNISIPSTKFFIGISHDLTSAYDNGSLSLFRIGSTSPSNDQIKEIYEYEKHLFQENSKCILSSSPSINTLEYNNDTNLLYIAGTTNLDTFNGLIRTNSESGVYTKLSSANNVIIKGN